MSLRDPEGTVHFLQSFTLNHNVTKFASCLAGQCDIPHQLAQLQIGPVSTVYTVTCGVSCPVSVYCDGVGCHVLCLYTVTGWGVMSCVLSVYCDGWGVMPCVCIL